MPHQFNTKEWQTGVSTLLNNYQTCTLQALQETVPFVLWQSPKHCAAG